MSNLNIENTLAYTSAIVMTFRNKEKVRKISLKNNGTKHLFDTIAKSLAGYDISANLPKTLDILDEEKNSWLLRKVYFTGITFGDKPITTSIDLVNNDYSTLLLNAIVTFDDIVPSTKAVKKVSEICIKDSEGKVLCQITHDVEDIISSVNKNTDAVIQWQLIFSNGISTYNNQLI